MLPINNIYLMDDLEFLKQIDDNSVDLILTDPPYNISQDGIQINRTNLDSKLHKRKSSVDLDFGDWDKRSEDNFYDFTENWFKECMRILKDGSWFFSFFSKERVGYFTDPRNGFFKQYGFKTRTIISWHKTNPTPSFRKMNFLSSCEHIVVGTKGEGRIPNFLYQKEMHNFYETSNSSIYGCTTHPTEKPLELIKWLIKIGSNEQDLILDPFIGSGTTAIASIMLNRKFIGSDNNQEYFKIAQKRINGLPNTKLQFFNQDEQNRKEIWKISLA